MINKLKRQAADKIKWGVDYMNRRPVRERFLFLITGTALVWGIWDGLLFSPLVAEYTRVTNARVQAEADYKAMTAQITMTIEMLKVDPKQPLIHKIAELQKEVDATQTELAALTHDLIAPDKMGGVLQEMLEATPNLQVIQLKSLTAEAVGPPGADGRALYRHGMEVQFVGQFFSTLYYLKMLEGLPVKLMWDLVEYEVSEYPNAKVRLVVRTLSEQTGFIGA